MAFPVPPGRDARGALFITWVVLAYLLIQLVASLMLQSDGTLGTVRRIGGIVVALAAAAGFLVLQALVLRGRGTTRPVLRWALVALGVLLLPLSETWAMLGFSFAALLITSSIRVSVLIGLPMTIVTLLMLWWHDAGVVALIAIPMACWLTAVVVAGLTRMVLVLEELRHTREHLARLQIDQERDRISRELHDIIGRTLVAVSVRTQTALRLLDRDVDGARDQLEQVAETASQGQAQLRALIRGAVIVGLDTELRTAADLFERLGIECEISVEPVAGERSRELAARILREAVTNMLKHARPHRAWISVRDEELGTIVTAVNDGVVGECPDRISGTGLAELSDLLGSARGTLEAGATDGDHFRVIGRIPHPVSMEAAAR